jgi:hypothetical protein
VEVSPEVNGETVKDVLTLKNTTSRNLLMLSGDAISLLKEAMYRIV